MAAALLPSIIVWALALLLVQGDDAPSASNFIRRNWHAAIVIDNYLYIDGGEVAQYVNGKADSQPSRPVNSTLSIPLDQSWTNASVKLQATSKGASPIFKGTTLWQDPTAKTILSFGGDASYSNKTNTPHSKVALWGFAVDGKGSGKWTQQQASNPAIFTTVLRAAFGAGTTCQGVGIINGGYGNEFTDSSFTTGNTIPVPGVLTYNVSSRAWANESATPFVKDYMYGSALCLPSYGVNGLVMFLGGFTTSATDADTTDVVRMDNITFYDPTAKTWYWQTTSGDAPIGRRSACTVIVKGLNGTSEIFVYGGDNHVQSSASLDDLYVLTIPGFQWFKGSSGTPRMGHKCVVAGNSQMISIGGANSDSGNDWHLPDPWTQGIGVLDLPTMTWKDGYDAQASAYDSPALVKSWYNANPTVTWDNDAAQSIFQAQTSNTPSTTPSTTPSATPSTTPSTTAGPDSGGGTSNAGAIAGGVVGGVVVLAAALGILWFLKRRSRRRYGTPGPDAAPAPLNYDPYAMPHHDSWQRPELGSPGDKPYQGEPSMTHELPQHREHLEMDSVAAGGTRHRPIEMEA